MGLNAVRYYFREAFASMRRNGWLSLASVGTVTVSLIILGCSLLLVLNANKLAAALEGMLEINVFLVDDLDREKIRQLNEQIKFLPGVAEVEFISREDALKKMQQSIGADKLEGLDYNPLPDAFRVKTRDPQQVPQVAGEIARLAGVEEVRYGQGLVEKLLAITRAIRIAGWVVMILLGGAAVFLISTTIRVSVFSRRKEINIMKYLGATNWFIRFPFLLEGMFLGLAGAFLAAVTVFYGYVLTVREINTLMPFLPIVSQFGEVLPVFACVVGLGLLIGAAGSALSVRRFLNV
ncbi:MAG: permease-like cell division protein FtsX [Armatimonadetes bacterium]|nr:permease-like cell division protein FtsX [Armatimonadota bacterium]